MPVTMVEVEPVTATAIQAEVAPNVAMGGFTDARYLAFGEVMTLPRCTISPATISATVKGTPVGCQVEVALPTMETQVTVREMSTMGIHAATLVLCGTTVAMIGFTGLIPCSCPFFTGTEVPIFPTTAGGVVPPHVEG